MLPLNFNFAQDVIDRLAGEDPSRAGLVFVDAHGHRRDYTFGEISDLSQRYAATLRAYGVGHGSRVVTCLSNTARCLFVLLALARLGAVAAPCGEELAPEAIAELARRISADTLIANRKRRGMVDGIRDRLPENMRFLLAGEEAEGWIRIDTLALTAKPFRGVTTQSADMAMIFEDDVLDYGALYEARVPADETIDPAASDRVWCTFPMGSQQWLTYVQAPWWRGASTVVHEGAFEPRERLDLLRELDVTILCQLPQEYEQELALQELARFRVPRLRRCIAVGQAVEEDVLDRWQQALGVALTPAAV